MGSVQPRLHFPTRLVVCLQEENTGRPVANVALTVTLFATKKNDYHLGPPLSDSSGRVVIDRSWVEASIQENRNFFLMDYSSTMDQCLPCIAVKVMSVDDIENAVAAMRLYGEATANSLGVAHTLSELLNASNRQYEPQEVEVCLDTPGESTREITLSLRRRRSACLS